MIYICFSNERRYVFEGKRKKKRKKKHGATVIILRFCDAAILLTFTAILVTF